MITASRVTRRRIMQVVGAMLAAPGFGLLTGCQSRQTSSATPTGVASTSSAPPAAVAPTVPVPSASATQATSVQQLKTAYSNVDADFLSFWIAEDDGLYTSHGLGVTEDLVSGGSRTMASLLAGEVKLGALGGSEVLSASSQGANLLVVATVTPIVPYLFYVTPEIKTIADLKGKKVGVSNFGGSADIATREALRREGLDPDTDVTIIAVGSHSARTAALLSGAIQGGVDDPPGSYQLEQKGLHALFNMVDLKIPTANTTVVGERAWIRDHAPIVQDYVDAIVDAFKVMRQDKQLAVTIMEKHLNSTNTDAMTQAYDHYVGTIAPKAPYPAVKQFQLAHDVLGQTDTKVAEISARRGGHRVAPASSLSTACVLDRCLPAYVWWE